MQKLHGLRKIVTRSHHLTILRSYHPKIPTTTEASTGGGGRYGIDAGDDCHRALKGRREAQLPYVEFAHITEMIKGDACY